MFRLLYFRHEVKRTQVLHKGTSFSGFIGLRKRKLRAGRHKTRIWEADLLIFFLNLAKNAFPGIRISAVGSCLSMNAPKAYTICLGRRFMVCPPVKILFCWIICLSLSSKAKRSGFCSTNIRKNYSKNDITSKKSLYSGRIKIRASSEKTTS